MLPRQALPRPALLRLPWLAALGVLLPLHAASGMEREAVRDDKDFSVLGTQRQAQRRVSENVLLALNEREATPAAATVPQIAVLIPDIGEPYRSVFQQIVDGIEERLRGRVLTLPVGDSSNAQDLGQELRRRDIRTVIALGRQGLKLASNLEREVNVLAGAVLSAPEADSRPMNVVSLTPDPALLFSRLRQIAPDTRRVFVVVDPKQNAWLMRLARESARTQGLDLQVLEAGDIKSAVRAYQEILAVANPRSDAIWLAQDSTTVDDSTVLPFLLQEAWNRSLVLFSSSAAHARRGALFSLLPSNGELGQSLAAAAQGMTAGSAARSIQPLRSVLLAVNQRTASHLGLSANLRGLTVDFSYPAP